MGDFMRDLGRGIRQSAKDRVDQAFADGFHDAANLAISTVTVKIDALTGQISHGQLLSDDEQVLLAGLTDLKSELDAEFRLFWRDASTGGQE